jgi:hypothetical protein
MASVPIVGMKKMELSRSRDEIVVTLLFFPVPLDVS